MTSTELPEDELEPVCAGCGLPQSEWRGEQGKGFVSRRGELYCCRDCAEGRACACEEVPDQREVS